MKLYALIRRWKHKHTAFGTEDPFPRENYEKSQVVRDGNIITSVGEAFVDFFSIEICDWFNLFDSSKEKNDFRSYIKGES